MLRFASEVSHNFMGIGKSFFWAIHPDEVEEMKRTGQGADIHAQTEFLADRPPMDCKAVAQNIKILSQQGNIPGPLKDKILNYIEQKPVLAKIGPSKWAGLAAAASLGLAGLFALSHNNKEPEDKITQWVGQDAVRFLSENPMTGTYLEYIIPAGRFEFSSGIDYDGIPRQFNFYAGSNESGEPLRYIFRDLDTEIEFFTESPSGDLGIVREGQTIIYCGPV